MNDNKQKRLEAIVRSLREMTVENGCTEAEALSAAEKARDLIDRYQLDIGSEEVLGEGLDKHAWDDLNVYEGTFIEWANLAIGRYCDVRTFRLSSTGRGKRRRGAAVGLASDLQFYRWLVASLMQFTIVGADAYIHAKLVVKGQRRLHYAMKMDFVKGCATRISERLNEMTEKRKRAAETGTRALVPLDKWNLIDLHLREAGINLKPGKKIAYEVNSASEAGTRYGDKANFGKPLPSGLSPEISKLDN